MNDSKQPGVYDRRSLFVWTLFCILAGLIFLVYALTSLTVGRGVFVMPLDDVYIHFQYAKQMALGQPYIYNPGLPPTSGATSFLYPYMLAIGYLLGFQGLNLGLWAMLLGMVALACSTWLVYRLVKIFEAPEWLAVLTGFIFALNGPVSWHFMSGMETGWIVLFTLGTLYSLILSSQRKNIRNAIIFATLLALIRPEGGILAGLAMAALFFQVRQRERARHVLPLLIPILAIGIQPLVNLLLTGSVVASGNAAKSVFGMIPFYWDAVIGRILGNWAQMWTEFFTGSSPREGLYIAPLMLVLSIVGLLFLLSKRQFRVTGLMLIAWLAFGTLVISTLDTVFWHFKRYQMPFIGLLFPLAGWGVAGILRWGSRTRYIVSLRYTSLAVWGATLVVASWTGVQFLQHFALNVDYVYQQPLQMARWLEANTPSDAVIAVHDVGMMRYMGGRTTLDMVGLTTPGAADYWRNGPGSVAEFLIAKRPDYIASYGYGHGFGLGMLADTDLYGQPLAGFPVDLDPNYNVALAANFQGIYKPDWEIINSATGLAVQPSICDNYFPSCIFPRSDGIGVLGQWIDVANIEEEKRANYRWINQHNSIGFPTEVQELDYVDCYKTLCRVLDGGRRINGEESFDINGRVDLDYAVAGELLITRLQPVAAGTIDIYVNDDYLATRWIPAFPGRWLEVATLIPSRYFGDAPTTLHIRIVPHIPNGYYMPYNHLIYYYPYDLIPKEPTKHISTFQDGAIVLASAKMDYEVGAKQMPINIDWYTDGSAQGDYKVFVHILDANDQIVAQADTYPGNGTLPPGNWLPGILHDRIIVDLSQTPPGKYRVAMGLYNPYTFERLQPTGGDDQNRFFIGYVEMK